ncbi:MAG: glycosyltransferase [Bacteriovoracaceae bacterium]
MQKVKVLVVGHPLVVNTNREVWSNLASDQSIEVDIICPKTWKANLIKNLEYQFDEQVDSSFSDVHALNTYFRGNGSLTFFCPIQLWNILRKKEYRKIILTQETWSLSLFVLSFVKLFTKNKRTQIWLWVCQNIKKTKLHFLRHFERMNNRDVEMIMGCCSETQDVVAWKNLKQECYYLPFSYNEKKFQFREKGRGKQGKITLGYIGRLTEEKGISMILNLTSSLLGPNDDIKIVGGGPLDSLVKADEKIDFIGTLPHDQAHLFYQDIDILLLPSLTREFWKEQFGRVIIEAASSGCLVVGSSSGAIPEVMKAVGFEKFIFEEGNQKDFEEKISLAINSLDDENLRQGARENCEKLFSHHSVAKLLSEYLLSRGERGRIKKVGEIVEFV